MNRATRRKKSVFKEFNEKLVIAGLRVIVNEKTPDGVMVVSQNEAERLSQMVADAMAKKIKPQEQGEGK